MARKPRISARSIPWLLDIDKRMRECPPAYADHVASDVLSGAAYRSEIDDLIRRRMLTMDAIPAGERPPHVHRGPPRSHDLCGSTFDVTLTERALRTFWPHKLPA